MNHIRTSLLVYVSAHIVINFTQFIYSKYFVADSPETDTDSSHIIEENITTLRWLIEDNDLENLNLLKFSNTSPLLVAVGILMFNLDSILPTLPDQTFNHIMSYYSPEVHGLMVEQFKDDGTHLHIYYNYKTVPPEIRWVNFRDPNFRVTPEPYVLNIYEDYLRSQRIISNFGGTFFYQI